MRLWLALLLLAAVVASALPAQAHQCSGTGCGPCVKGENHQHADEHGACNSGPGFIQEAGYGGVRNDVPAGGLLAALVGLSGGALLRPRAR